ncbi:MAG: hypothetical protein ACLP7O_06885 [Terracidiphilus sp.]
MRRVRISQTLLAALLASAATGAAPAANTRGGAAPSALSGVYSVSFTVNSGSALAPGAAILCKAKAVPNAPPLKNLQLEAVPVASGWATLTGSRVTGYWAMCTVRIPFYWAASNAQNNTPGGAVLSYEIDAVSGPGAPAVPVSRQEGIGVAYPAPGGSASLSFNVRF